ncbi:MAG: hypothetical protein ABSH03_16985 [Candidatus Lustribacter sp.]
MYYAELTVAEPIEKLLGDWDLLEDRVVKKLTAFKELNDQVIGVRRRLFENNAVFDPVKGKLPESQELTPKGILTTKYEMLTLNMTVGGTPHRVPNSFGYWHINDADEMYLTLPPPVPGGDAYFLVIMGLLDASSNAGESWAQYCQICLTMLHERYYKNSQFGLEGHYKANLAAIREYNGDVRLRTCPECGHVNPLAYAWNTVKDTPEEAAARKVW